VLIPSTIIAGVYEDPELRFSAAGKPWVTIRTVVKDRKKDSNNQWVDGPPRFVTIKVFGPVAENVAETVQRGDSVIAVGKLDIEEYTTQSGEDRKVDVMIAEEIGVSLRWAAYRKEGRDTASGTRNVSPRAASQTSLADDDAPPF
jgi:single-strand DNA-binding protein